MFVHRIALPLTLASVMACAQIPKFVISTLAGAPLAAQPVPALSVAIGSPRGIAVDNAGNVYFTTTSPTYGANFNSVLKLDRNGTLSDWRSPQQCRRDCSRYDR